MSGKIKLQLKPRKPLKQIIFGVVGIFCIGVVCGIVYLAHIFGPKPVKPPTFTALNSPTQWTFLPVSGKELGGILGGTIYQYHLDVPYDVAIKTLASRNPSLEATISENSAEFQVDKESSVTLKRLSRSVQVIHESSF